MRRGRASLEAFLVVMAAGTASLPAPSRTGRLAAVPAHPPIALVFGPLMLLPYAGYEPRQSLGIYSRIALSYAQKEYQAGHRAVPPLTISGTTGGGDSRSSGCRVTSPTAETDTLVSLSPRPNWELCRFQNRKLQSSGGALSSAIPETPAGLAVSREGETERRPWFEQYVRGFCSGAR